MGELWYKKFKQTSSFSEQSSKANNRLVRNSTLHNDLQITYIGDVGYLRKLRINSWNKEDCQISFRNSIKSSGVNKTK